MKSIETDYGRRIRVSEELRGAGYPLLAGIVRNDASDATVREADRLRKNAVILIPKPSTVLRRLRGAA